MHLSYFVNCWESEGLMTNLCSFTCNDKMIDIMSGLYDTGVCEGV